MRRTTVAALLAVVTAAAGLALARAGVSSPGASAPRSVAGVPRFQHVIVVVFENKENTDIAGNSDAPTFNSLASKYASLTNYTAVTHPSLPNYLALVSGSTQGITDDCTTCVVSARNLSDTLAAAKKSWKTYTEGLPRAGWTGSISGSYAKKHDPFLYFRDVLANPRRRQAVVPFGRLQVDVRARKLPSFALVVPDLCNDMHDCSVATGDAWLRARIAPLLKSKALGRGVVFVVFDEGTTDTGGGGTVFALALGPLVRPGATYDLPTSHYGLLRTIEAGLGLPALGASATAQPITGIWR